ncbi:hypothetical protein OG2516_15349 [Oceanicola granulosus HTCC2516]|uniref:DUF305 domain-containing protein n=1 Tax=Oceanicola granulosus (strain ATCC BAA-861 / DSM 15982 / KCTC 12143 / HTCC2516) TaxID=314256 RepID=Q2CFE3_OCEGH|nr:DUF6692 family protein [Oceanicola granulosus]EAR51352.1 hypothetical protein OG2516_15349 [Oceanicola granulosus HTCC2516]
MSYVKFGLMILTSTVVMFILMYLNTYAWEHLFWSETRTYMAILMGATMAIIMLAYMLGMYDSKAMNAAIFVGAIVVFGVSLWLVRSQTTVSGPSYMRAMIPHHSIAVMTSERAQIEDARVRHLADEIIAAQRKEIAEMRYLIDDVADGNVVREIYEDPPAAPGSVEDALDNTLISQLDLSPLTEAEAGEVVAGPTCTFNRSPEADPILWTAADGGAAMKLNGVIVGLEESGEGDFATDGARVAVRLLGDEANWRSNAALTFELEEGLSVGYRGFFDCTGSDGTE